MRISGWECVINHDGTVRVAKNLHGGSIAWVGGRIIAQCDAPAEVVEWLMRPRLRSSWRNAFDQGMTYESLRGSHLMRDLPPNPYDGEPPNKDHEPS